VFWVRNGLVDRGLTDAVREGRKTEPMQEGMCDGGLFRLIVDLLRYDNFVVCYTESYPQRIT